MSTSDPFEFIDLKNSKRNPSVIKYLIQTIFSFVSSLDKYFFILDFGKPIEDIFHVENDSSFSLNDLLKIKWLFFQRAGKAILKTLQIHTLLIR